MRAEIENGDVSKLRARALEVQYKMLQRHPDGDNNGDGDSVFEGDFHSDDQ